MRLQEELEAEKKRIQEQLERDREERRKAAEARERARIAKATGVSTNETSTADKTTAEKGKGGKVWLKAAEKAGVDVEKVQEKKLSMADLAKIQLSKLNHER